VSHRHIPQGPNGLLVDAKPEVGQSGRECHEIDRSRAKAPEIARCAAGAARPDTVL
jgi:hypothetical protein